MKDNLKQGLKEALVSRGKNKGLLKVKCPPVGSLGSAVWSAIQGFSNPYKVGVCHLLFMSDEGKEVYKQINEIGKKVDLSKLDRDANILKELKIW